MILSADTPIHSLIAGHPYLVQVLADHAPAFARLRKPLLHDAEGRAATLQQAADIAGLELTGLMAHLARAIMEQSGIAVTLVPKGATVPAEAGAASMPHTAETDARLLPDASSGQADEDAAEIPATPAEALRLAAELDNQIDRMRTRPGDASSPLDELAWSFSRRYVNELLLTLFDVVERQTATEGHHHAMTAGQHGRASEEQYDHSAAQRDAATCNADAAERNESMAAAQRGERCQQCGARLTRESSILAALHAACKAMTEPESARAAAQIVHATEAVRCIYKALE